MALPSDPLTDTRDAIGRSERLRTQLCRSGDDNFATLRPDSARAEVEANIDRLRRDRTALRTVLSAIASHHPSHTGCGAECVSALTSLAKVALEEIA